MVVLAGLTVENAGRRVDPLKLKISIALCTLNGETFLPEQLESIAAQTQPPGELIVCDDGSTDSTLRLVETFASRVRFPVHVTRNAARQGTNRNFQQAISLCQGQIIFLADQDDIWSPDKIEALTGRFDADENLACVFSDALRVDSEGREIPGSLWKHIHFTERLQERVHVGHALDVLAADNYATGATMAFRARWRDAIVPIPGAGIVHDDWIALVLSGLARVECDERRLTRYRQHEGQQVGSGPGAGGVGRWVSAARATGPAAYAARAARLELALERLRNVGASLAVVHSLEERILHLRTRASLPQARMARLSVIAGELPRYFRYSNHVWSIAKDLLGN
jgi:hypothetical protein